MKNFLKNSSVFSFAFLIYLFVLCCVFSCAKIPEMTLEEIEKLANSEGSFIENNTIKKNWKNEGYVAGKVGGVWRTSITSDPKSFNLIVAERDGATSGVLAYLYDSLFDYDFYTREWKGRLGEPKIHINQKDGTMDLFVTLRDDVYWTFVDSDEKIKVTSDDVIFWYNEIEGDPEMQSSGYNGQFLTFEDGTEAHIDIEKIDDRTFVYHFPRIIAEPLLHTNTIFGPKFIYEKAKKEGGVQGVKSICSIDSDPKKLPSIGMCYISEYSPSQRIVYTRNPHYWEKDLNGNASYYPEKMIADIVSDHNLEYLRFKEGNRETYNPRPEELIDVINNSNDEYSVFNGGPSLGGTLWSFNQNPKNDKEPYYKWFTQTKFRQAMSCIFNRERVIDQTFRGLASPKYTFFADSNPYFNPEIQLDYKFDLERAVKLLSEIGIEKKSDGFMYDKDGNKIEFDLTIYGNENIVQDYATIISDEASKIGITIKIRVVDFQKLVEMITVTYDWQSLIVGLSSPRFPTQGSNVWPSSGNMHLWYPLQKEPATDWEARIDQLYNEGSCTVDSKKAQKIWDEYQTLILEQCPVIYLVRPQSFYAIRNKWDLSNFYFDSEGSVQTEHVFLSR